MFEASLKLCQIGYMFALDMMNIFQFFSYRLTVFALFLLLFQHWCKYFCDNFLHRIDTQIHMLWVVNFIKTILSKKSSFNFENAQSWRLLNLRNFVRRVWSSTINIHHLNLRVQLARNSWSSICLIDIKGCTLPTFNCT